MKELDEELARGKVSRVLFGEEERGELGEGGWGAGGESAFADL